MIKSPIGPKVRRIWPVAMCSVSIMDGKLIAKAQVAKVKATRVQTKVPQPMSLGTKLRPIPKIL